MNLDTSNWCVCFVTLCMYDLCGVATCFVLCACLLTWF